ncbi:hypothetical protein SpCBS45565_g05439 [Spizellomyces sp. 'palustris']|nr:hypothetical protein SpCBS45565_g05439 [Spizellomyces sp. 'palustris']
MNLTHHPPSPSEPTCPHLLYLSFNQTASHFCLGTDAGFRIYATNPPKLLTAPTIGGIHVVEMLYATNYVAVVKRGGRGDRDKVVVWDAKLGKCVMEIMVGERVVGVRLRRDRLVVATTSKIFVYSFSPTPERLAVFDTLDNSLGLLSLSTSPTHPAVLAFPGRSQGQIQLLDLPAHISTLTPPTHLIPAHTSPLACLALSPTGALLASASDKGTLIRVFCTRTKRLVHELRRGADQARIYCVAFNEAGTRVCVASDKGTIHVFHLTLSSEQQQEQPQSQQEPHKSTLLASLSPFLPKYFSSQWSFAQFRLALDTRCVCAFIPEPREPAREHRETRQSVSVLCADGSLYFFSYNVDKGGEASRDGFQRVFKGLRAVGEGEHVRWEEVDG